MLNIKCECCSVVVAKLKDGSQLRKGVVMLCDYCDTKRRAMVMDSRLSACTTPKSSYSDMFNSILGKK